MGAPLPGSTIPVYDEGEPVPEGTTGCVRYRGRMHDENGIFMGCRTALCFPDSTFLTPEEKRKVAERMARENPPLEPRKPLRVRFLNYVFNN